MSVRDFSLNILYALGGGYIKNTYKILGNLNICDTKHFKVRHLKKILIFFSLGYIGLFQSLYVYHSIQQLQLYELENSLFFNYNH